LLIKGSKVDCTVPITDHNVARWIAHKDIADGDFNHIFCCPRKFLNQLGCHQDLAVAAQLLSQFVGYYCHRIQQDNIGLIFPLTFGSRDPSLTNIIRQSIRPIGQEPT
jgi:hypothetical protein